MSKAVPAAKIPVSTAPLAAPPVASQVTVAPAKTTTTEPTATPSSKPDVVLHAEPMSSHPPGQTKRGNELVTANGSSYQNAEVERVMSDGIVISYTPVGGGIGMTKIPFSDLTPEIRQRYQKK